MLQKIKAAINKNIINGKIYLIEKISAVSGFFVSDNKVLYIVANFENEVSQSMTTEFLRLNTNLELMSIENYQQFESGRYNVLEFLSIENQRLDEDLDVFINLCLAHTKHLEARDFVKFFYSLASIFQKPKEQQYKDLIGLYGELLFLKKVYDVTGQDISMHWHTNGSNDKYDILLKSCNIEIKTTSSDDGLVTIKHSQLFNIDKNYLVCVILEEDNAGKSLNQFIKESKNSEKVFNNYNFILNLEKERKRISPVDAEKKKFLLKSLFVFEADKINPFAKIPSNVANLSYRLEINEDKCIQESKWVNILGLEAEQCVNLKKEIRYR